SSWVPRVCLFDQRADAFEIDTAIPVHPDRKRLADDILLRDETPVAAVLAIIAIIAHCEIVSRGNMPRSLASRQQHVGFEQMMLGAGNHLVVDLGARHFAAFVA